MPVTKAVYLTDSLGNPVPALPAGQGSAAGSAPVVLPTSQETNLRNLQSVTPGTGPTQLGKAEDAVHASGDVGIQVLGVRNDNVATALTSATGDYSPIATDPNGALFVQSRPLATAGTPVATVPSGANQQILAANPARRGAMIVNRSGQEIFLRYGATAATTTLFSWPLANGEKYEVPFGITAAVQMISAAAGAAPGVLVTEFSA